MGLKREHKENLDGVKTQGDVQLFNVRGEHAAVVADYEEKIGHLTQLVRTLNDEVEKYRSEAEKLKLIADIGQLDKVRKLSNNTPYSEVLFLLENKVTYVMLLILLLLLQSSCYYNKATLIITKLLLLLQSYRYCYKVTFIIICYLIIHP
jgi:uncharacterized membrane protein